MWRSLEKIEPEWGTVGRIVLLGLGGLNPTWLCV